MVARVRLPVLVKRVRASLPEKDQTWYKTKTRTEKQEQKRKLTRFSHELQILTARRLDRLESLKQELSEKHSAIQIHTMALDIREKKNIDKAVAELPVKDIDVLVNNAGLVIGMDHLEKVTEEAYNTMFDTNVKGLVFLTQALLPHMKARQAGHIINLGSANRATLVVEFIAVQHMRRKRLTGSHQYLASKFAVEAITRALLYELVDTPIRVSQICPGMVNTEFSTIRFGGDKKKADDVYKGMQPLVGQDIGKLPDMC
ncbi:hypothetical protein DFQ28_006871 [Apophysomyces sp. BC1034]|nr:hypothetical protein DFQ28_006871 [Apophysomyces sp. BC1034]